MSLELALLIHCFVMALVLGWATLTLWRRGMLTVLHSGAWVVFASGLYFLWNPVVSLMNDDLALYEQSLMIMTRAGPEQVFRILATVVMGILVFVSTYARNRNRIDEAANLTTALPKGKWSMLQLAVLTALLAAALYSLLFLRTRGQFVESDVTVQYDRGRVVGGATGYTIIAHAFFLYIVVILILRGPTLMRRVGLSLGAGFIVLRLFDTHDRSSIVALMAAVAMVSVLRRDSSGEPHRPRIQGRLKRLMMMGAAVAMALFLIVRGHTSIAEVREMDVERAQEVMRRNDTAMLPIFYVTSYYADETGYDYAIPLINRAMFGWLPRQYFPWKDRLPELLLEDRSKRIPSYVDEWLVGAKSTILGSFYNHGGLVGVIVGMALLGGVAARGLDRLARQGKTDLVRAVGIVWMANVWIMFASSDIWVMGNLFINAIPFIALYVISRMDGARGPTTEVTVASARYEVNQR